MLNFNKGNNFYINGTIDDNFSYHITSDLIKLVNAYNSKSDPINIYINSSGGISRQANMLINVMEKAISNNVVINTYLLGTAFSAASKIAIVGTKRYVSHNACHLIHYPRADRLIDHTESFERELEYNSYLKTETIQHYLKYSKYTEEELKDHLKSDNYYVIGAEEIIKNGLADEIY